MTKLAMLTLWLATLGCGLSPLFNHIDGSTLLDPSSGGKTSPECELRFQRAPLCGTLSWVVQPDQPEGGTLKLVFWNPVGGSPQGPYLEPPGTLYPYLWMPDHGHGSSPILVRPTANGGEFLLSEIFFVMPGRWQLRVQLKSGISVIDEAQVEYVIRD